MEKTVDLAINRVETKRKTVKIKFVGYWPGFKPQDNIVYRILLKYFEVEVSDNPDYIICSMFGNEYEYCNYPQVRVMCVGENYVPDYNIVDYSISRYPISYYDRNFYLIGCADNCEGKNWFELENRDRNYTENFLAKKEYFANFIASHDSEDNIRGDFFKQLSKYKRVESIGSYLNNMEDARVVSFQDDSKTEFQRKCKFTLCFESTAHDGFITEKISDAFYADTIPVYFGSSNITEIFNEKAFVLCKGRDDFQRTIDQIIELDNDDNKYLQMLREPIFVNPNYPSDTQKELEEYVKHIFDQPLEKAYRRSRVYHPKWHEEFLQKAKVYEEGHYLRRIYRHIIRKIKGQ